MGPISEGTRARLSALGLIAALGLIVGVALAGRPPQLRPAETFPAGPSATPEHRQRIYGEDGIFGLPGWPWRAPEATATR